MTVGSCELLLRGRDVLLNIVNSAGGREFLTRVARALGETAAPATATERRRRSSKTNAGRSRTLRCRTPRPAGSATRPRCRGPAATDIQTPARSLSKLGGDFRLGEPHLFLKEIGQVAYDLGENARQRRVLGVLGHGRSAIVPARLFLRGLDRRRRGGLGALHGAEDEEPSDRREAEHQRRLTAGEIRRRPDEVVDGLVLKVLGVAFDFVWPSSAPDQPASAIGCRGRRRRAWRSSRSGSLRSAPLPI